jgi:hypothetical protein
MQKPANILNLVVGPSLIFLGWAETQDAPYRSANPWVAYPLMLLGAACIAIFFWRLIKDPHA